ncbi:S1C family serine protease [Micrococcus luteus]
MSYHQQPAPNDAHGQTPQSPVAAQRSPKRIGTGMLAACVLAAGLVGGGVGAGAVALTQGEDAPAAASSEGGGGQDAGGQDAGGQDSGGVSASQDARGAEGAGDASGTVASAAERASASVVTISTASRSGAGSGSGVVLDDQGHILTNNHVVTMGGQTSDAEITVQTADGSVYVAEVVGTDPKSDLAVIKVEAEGLTPIGIGSSKDLAVGDQVIAIGAPLGLAGTVTDGIVSTLNRTIAVASSEVPDDTDQGSPYQFQFPQQGREQQAQGSVFLNVMQTDAAINPGNSGGALVDENGDLLGINVAIASTGGSQGEESGNIGVGFAIPVDYAHRIAEKLIADGEVEHAFLGVSVTPAQAEVEGGDRSTRTQFSAGAEVREVVSGSPADKAGLKQGDVVTKVDGTPVQDSESLTATVRQFAPGDEAEVTVRRNGKEQTLKVAFAANDDES